MLCGEKAAVRVCPESGLGNTGAAQFAVRCFAGGRSVLSEGEAVLASGWVLGRACRGLLSRPDLQEV